MIVLYLEWVLNIQSIRQTQFHYSLLLLCCNYATFFASHGDLDRSQTSEPRTCYDGKISITICTARVSSSAPSVTTEVLVSASSVICICTQEIARFSSTACLFLIEMHKVENASVQFLQLTTVSQVLSPYS